MFETLAIALFSFFIIVGLFTFAAWITQTGPFE